MSATNITRVEDLPNPEEYPVLTSERHRNYKPERPDSRYWIHDGWGTIYHFHHAIRENDAAVVREFCKLRPGCLQWEDRYAYLVPALTAAVDKPAVLDVLLEHRDNLRKAGLVKLTLPKFHDVEGYNTWKQTRPRWANPLAVACKIDTEKYIEHGRDFPTVKRVLAKMPELDINDHDNEGNTALLEAAGCSNGGWCGVEDASAGMTDAEIEQAIYNDNNGSGALISFLIENGADPNLGEKAVYKVYDLDETTNPPTATVVEKRELVSSVWRGYHGGPPLIVAMKNQAGFSTSDPAAIAALMRGGADINKGRSLALRECDDRETYFMTPLVVAALYHNVTGIKTLLYMAKEKGIDMTAQLTSAIPSKRVMPPIHAALHGWPTAKYKGGGWYHAGSLEPGKGFPEAYNDAMEAAMDTVRVLVADPKIKEATLNARAPYDGLTPLQRTASFTRLPMLRAILDLGADPSIPMPKTNHSVVYELFSTLPCVAPPLDYYLAENIEPELYLDINCREYGEDEDKPEPTIEDAKRELREFAEYECAPSQKSVARADEVMDMHALVRDLLRGAKSEEERLAWLNETDASGNTALHWVAAYNLPNSKAALIAHGARTDIQNKFGEVPTDGQLPTLPRPIVEFLRKWGEDDTVE